jgi:predicted alpha-1,6-mannanase (GH76 family)
VGKIAALLLLLASFGPAQSVGEFSSDAAAGVATLQSWYDRQTGLWKTTHWWNAANGVTVLVRYSKLSGSTVLRPTIANTFERNSHANFLNEYYDDEGWWALAWSAAYEWSHDSRYIEMAGKIFDDMTTGWDDTCGGGIWWRKDRHYKNAIANELFLSVAASLARLSPDARRRTGYLNWAKREWQWFSASGMINPQNLINDGLDAGCHNNGRTTWTYNQGVVLGGLTAMSQDTGDASLIDRARSLALAAIAHLTGANGILHDPCEPKCGADAVQFKGIFARNLALLNNAAPDRRFCDFLRANAASIVRNQTADHRFGVVWSAPSGEANAATQISALDAILSAEECGVH